MPLLDLSGMPDYRSYSNVQPFTVRDGAAYLLQLEELKKWLRDYVIPTLNLEVEGLAETWTTQTRALIEAFEKAVTDLTGIVDSKILELETRVDDKIEEFGEEVDAAVAAVNATAAGVAGDRAAAEAARIAAEAAAVLAEQYASAAEGIQDLAVSNIFKNTASALRIAMDAAYIPWSRADGWQSLGTAVDFSPLYYTGFESGNPLDLGWTRDPGTSTSWLNATGEDSGYTFVVYTNTAGNENNNRVYRTMTGLVIGQEYTVSYRERIHGTAGGLTAQTGVHVSGIANAADTVANDVWRTVTRKFVATATTHQVGVWVKVVATGGSNGVRIDNFSIAKSGSETRYAAPGTDGGEGNIYNILYTRALGPRWQVGTKEEPTADPRPVMWLHKYSKADRPGIVPGEWDQLLYAQITKSAGAAYAAAVTGYVRHDGGSGQTIGMHGRSIGYKTDSDVFGMWAYAGAGDPNTVPRGMIALEADLNNKAPDQGWGAGVGSSRGIVIVGADGSNPNTIGLDIGTQSSSPNGKFWTGIRLRANGTMAADTNSADQVNNGEAMLIEGSTQQSQSYNGIRFRGGNLKTGISFAEVAIDNNAAILFKSKQRIVVGPGPGVSTYLELQRETVEGATEAFANFSNLPIHVNGSRVVGPRRTGWASPTGTSSKSAFDTATVSTATLAQHFKALLDDLMNHGLIGA